MALKIARVNDRKTSEQYEAMGLKEFAAGNLEQAAAHFLSALELDEKNASLFLKLGTIFLKQGKADKALIALKRSLELDPYSADAYNAMGVVLFEHAYWGAAEAFFRKAMALDAEHPTAKSSMVEAMKQKRNGDNEPPSEFDSVLALLEVKEPTLSLCMIAKNEELFLEDCLASVRDVVDEIILVDTGSTDRTVEIAERFGAKVFHFPWNGDFAAARNESLAHATGDWILVLDADETIPAESHAELKKVLRNRENAGYSLIIENLLGKDGEKSQMALIFRLFQNRPEIRFEGIIHEQAMPAAKRTGLPVQNARVRILHRGYLDQYLTQRDKYQRNLDMLLRQVAEEPENAYAFFNLGQTYKLRAEFTEAARAYETSLELLINQQAPNTTAYWPQLYFSFIDLYRVTKEYETGLKLSDEALARFPNFPDILFTKGYILLELERFDEAIQAFQDCRTSKGVVYAAGNDPSVPTYKSSQALGAAYSRKGQHAQAKRHYLEALQEWDHPNAELFTNLGVVHLQLGELKPALQYFVKAIEINEANAQAWSNIGYICQQLGQPDEALAAREKAYGISPEENAFAYGTALLHARRYEDAERIFAEQTTSSPEYAPGWTYLALIKLCLGKRDEARGVWDQLRHATEFDAQVHADARAFVVFCDLLEGNEFKLDEALQLTKRDGELWVLALGHLMLAERYVDVERALGLLQRCDVPELHLQLGRMLLQHGLAEEAMGALLTAREKTPEATEVYVLLGEAAEAMANLEDAQVMYQMALSLDPKLVAVRQRLGRLRLMATSK